MNCFKSKKLLLILSRRSYNTISSSIFDVLIDEHKTASHRCKKKLKDFPLSKTTAKDITAIEKSIFGSPIVIRENLDEIDHPKEKKNYFNFQWKKSNEYTKMSCNFFSPENKIRVFCIYLITSTKIKYFDLSLILIHSILLGFYDYHTKKKSDYNEIIDVLEPIFLTVYAIEMTFKIIAQGFYAEPNTYLRNIYNLIDFFVVITAIFSYNTVLQHLGILRLFRVLIFLEKLAFLESMNLLMKSLQKSIIHLMIILSLLAFTLLVFSIISLNWWKETEFLNEDISLYTKYGSIQESLLTNLEVYLKENWQEKFYALSGKTSSFISATYLIILLIICSNFISNMFVAAVFSNYVKIIREIPKHKKIVLLDLKMPKNVDMKKSEEFVKKFLLCLKQVFFFF